MSRWLLLAYQLPGRPSHVRVKTWRRLQQIPTLGVAIPEYPLPEVLEKWRQRSH